jgi:uncharacterized Fe-S center protein
MFINNTCNGCGICVDLCLGKAIYLADDKAVINYEKCLRCGICVNFCDLGAIREDWEKMFYGMGAE